MSNITKGIIAGLIFGIVSIIPMIFLPFENKARAMTASFISRFAIGFIIFNMELGMPGWLKGGIVGLVHFFHYNGGHLNGRYYERFRCHPYLIGIPAIPK
jgi:hypothetical protein